MEEDYQVEAHQEVSEEAHQEVEAEIHQEEEVQDLLELTSLPHH